MFKKICGGAALAAALIFSPAQGADFELTFGAAFNLAEDYTSPEYLLRGTMIFSAEKFGDEWESVRDVEVFLNGRRLDIGEVSVSLQDWASPPILSVGSARAPGIDSFGFSITPRGNILAVGLELPSLELSLSTTIAGAEVAPLSEVSAVPESSSLAMMLGGLGVLGAVARRRRTL